jgi:hypothetical protein
MVDLIWNALAVIGAMAVIGLGVLIVAVFSTEIDTRW